MFGRLVIGKSGLVTGKSRLLSSRFSVLKFKFMMIFLFYTCGVVLFWFFSSKMGDLKDGFRYGTKEFVERTYKNHRQVVDKSKW